MAMFEKKNWPPGHPTAPQSPTPGAWQRWKNDNPVWYVLYLSFVQHTHSLVYKIFEIDMLIKIWWYLTFWPDPNPRMKILLAFCSARHPRRFDTWQCLKKKIFMTPSAHPAPKVRPLGHDPGNRIKIPSDMFCIFHLWKQTQSLVLKIFDIDFVIEIKWYLNFWSLPRAPGGGAKKVAVARPIHVSNTHTKFGWISSNGLGGDSITDRRTDGRTRLQYPLRFFKKAWG